MDTGLYYSTKDEVFIDILVTIPKTSYVMCEQIRVVDMKRLKNRVARLPDEDILEVKRKMLIQLRIK